MLRSAILVVVIGLFFSNISLAAGDRADEVSKQFTQAQNLAAQGKVTQAISAYETLIRSNPVLPEAYNNLAGLYLQQNKTKQAKHILEQGLHAHKGYGVLYESLTAINVAMAREAYSKALQIDLKASPISIASLSLSKTATQPQKNTIVISKTDTPTVEKKSKTITEVKSVKAKLKSKAVAEMAVVSNAASKKVSSPSVEKTLQAWSVAWSAQAADMYLSFYHHEYKPTNGLSRKGWEQSRRYRLKKPQWIKVGLSNLDIRKQSNSQAVVNFKQMYHSNTFKDVSYKQMVLVNTNDGWRIFRERNL